VVGFRFLGQGFRAKVLGFRFLGQGFRVKVIGFRSLGECRLLGRGIEVLSDLAEDLNPTNSIIKNRPNIESSVG
jgi:hypothetical protein